jgi:hypothetical protein
MISTNDNPGLWKEGGIKGEMIACRHIRWGEMVESKNLKLVEGCKNQDGS